MLLVLIYRMMNDYILPSIQQIHEKPAGIYPFVMAMVSVVTRRHDNGRLSNSAEASHLKGSIP